MKPIFFSRRIYNSLALKKPLRKRGWKWLRSYIFSKKGFLFFLGILFIGMGGWIYWLLGDFRPFFWNIPEIIGLGSEKSYLLLLHNENELRPTGGFITSSAVITVQGGRPQITFFNSEEVSLPNPKISAPEPLERVLSRGEKYAGWTYRDSNFSLDFPTNAIQAVDFLSSDPRFASISFDGVVAMDTKFLEDIIALYEPLLFESTTLRAANFFETIQGEAKNFDLHDEDSWKSRKNILTPLAQQLIKNALSKPSRWKSLLRVIQDNADQKHLLLFSFDEAIQSKLTTKNWSGELPQAPFFHVNFANLGGRKADRFLRKEFFSSFHTEATGELTERFSIYLAHEGTYNLQSDRYEAYVRLIRPVDVEMKNFSGEFEAPPIKSTSSHGEEIAFFVVLYPGEQHLLTFEFSFPDTFDFSLNNTQNIHLLKQAGTQGIPWKTTFRAENDHRFGVQGCTNAISRENIFFCDVFEDTDTTLQVTRGTDRTPPLLQFARFLNVTELEIRFSEDISPNLTAQDISLVDQNIRSGGGDTIFIEDLEIIGEKLFLRFSGMTENTGEQFLLTIKNLQDISGNKFERNGSDIFTTTIVQ